MLTPGTNIERVTGVLYLKMSPPEQIHSLLKKKKKKNAEK